jgi:beta-lactamase regulating signal transducer with metallopeptidase domain
MTTALLLELAWKSTLTLGATLIILRLLRHRSAAERSWLAHAGLLATLALPLILLAAPRWKVEAPAPVVEVLAPTSTEAPAPAIAATADAVPAALPGEGRDPAQMADRVPALAGMTAEDSPLATLSPAVLVYALPAAVLLGLTLVAIFRLVGLRRRASVIVENGWLAALAQAQRRMGFKHGTALLVSPDIGSPVSWGVMRPVILLNEAAIGSAAQAEAIIAHELAHVARLDWAKLLLARITAALFWFNPLVWVLTRQCHQLREESADDAVLAHDVPDLDYAELLVGVARHESGALLLAANGVAPSRGSLAQRVTRVLDTSLRRAPARFGWTAGVTLGATLLAAPLAALSLGAASEEVPVASLRLLAASAPAPAAVPARAVPAAAPAPAAAQTAAAAPTATAPTAAEAPSPLPAADALAEPIALALAVANAVAATVPAPPAAPAPPVAPAELAPFDAIALQGGGNVVLRHGPRQQVRVTEGDPRAVRLTVSRGRLAISGCDGNCRNTLVEVTMPASPGAIAIQGGGAITARGNFPAVSDMAVAIEGGGSVDVQAIPAEDVAAAVRGGGSIATRVRQELAAQVIGGGSISYWGDPAVASAIRGGGTVARGGN